VGAYDVDSFIDENFDTSAIARDAKKVSLHLYKFCRENLKEIGPRGK
jgi:hypothetical protein